MSLNHHSGHSSRDTHIPAFGFCSAPTARLPTLLCEGSFVNAAKLWSRVDGSMAVYTSFHTASSTLIEPPKSSDCAEWNRGCATGWPVLPISTVPRQPTLSRCMVRLVTADCMPDSSIETARRFNTLEIRNLWLSPWVSRIRYIVVPVT